MESDGHPCPEGIQHTEIEDVKKNLIFIYVHEVLLE